MKISLVCGGGAPLKAWAVGVNCRANYTTAMQIPLHNFRLTNFVDKSEDEGSSGISVVDTRIWG